MFLMTDLPQLKFPPPFPTPISFDSEQSEIVSCEINVLGFFP